MGAAWCRERAARAQDSKSPFDRVIVKCVNQMSPEVGSNTSKDIVSNARQTQIRAFEGTSHVKSTADVSCASGWQEVVLKVPDLPTEHPRSPDCRAPIPPPRKKRRQSADKPVDAVRKSPTPVIYLEVGTPVSKHRSTASTLSLPPKLESTEKKVLVDSDDLLRIPRAASSMSMTSRRSISSMSEATSEKLDNYLRSCRSFGSLKPDELITEINQALEAQSGDSSDSDAWAGLDDWDLGIVDYDARTGTPPLTPTSQLAERKGRKRAEFSLGNPAKKAAPRKKRSTGKNKVEKDEKSIQGPVNFQSNPQSGVAVNAASGSLIKPSHIPVKEFLRQSSSSLQEKRNSSLTVDCGLSPKSSFSFDFRKGLAPPHSPQIELPGTPCTPRGLSRCSSPLPKQFINVNTPPSSPSAEDNAYSWTNEEDVTHSTLLQLLNEYHAAAELIGDDDARKILKNLGIPESLGGESDPEGEFGKAAVGDGTKQRFSNHGSSGRSSTTPSLTELEEALSDLLETNAGKEGEEDDEVQMVDSVFVPIRGAEIEKMKVKPEITKEVENTETETQKPKEVKKKVESEPCITEEGRKKKLDLAKLQEEAKVIAMATMSGKAEVDRAIQKEDTPSGFVPIKQGVKSMKDIKPEITITGCNENQEVLKCEEIKGHEEKKCTPPQKVHAGEPVHNEVSHSSDNDRKLINMIAVDDRTGEQLLETSDNFSADTSVYNVEHVITTIISIEDKTLQFSEEANVEGKRELLQNSPASKTTTSLENDRKQEVKISAPQMEQSTTAKTAVNCDEGSTANSFEPIKEDQLFPVASPLRRAKTDNDLTKTEQLQS